MLLFRSLSIGLIAACFLLQLDRGRTDASVAVSSPPIAAALAQPGVTVIDVAGVVRAEQLPSLVRLARDEHVISVDNQIVASDLDAGEKIARHDAAYVDLNVASAENTTRRVLLLLH